jgi:hypothetical protein
MKFSRSDMGGEKPAVAACHDVNFFVSIPGSITISATDIPVVTGQRTVFLRILKSSMADVCS